MLINPQTQILATSDMGVVDTAARQGFKLIFVGDQMEIPSGYNFVNAVHFTPDYKTICAIIENGDDALVSQLYFASLSTPVAEETFAVIIGALSQGNNIMIYFPNDTLQLKYPYLLLHYILERFGIRIGDKNTPCSYNPAYDTLNLRLLYIYRIIPWNSFIMAVNDLDPVVLIRLREDLCELYSIPVNISDEEMVVKVQQIKDQLIAQMSANKPLFERVENNKKPYQKNNNKNNKKGRRKC